jgi:predicted RNA-binding Zn ribbon-like protein
LLTVRKHQKITHVSCAHPGPRTTAKVLHRAAAVPAMLTESAVLALRDQLATHPDRLGICHDRHYADVYVDASPAGHRRFCSLTCQNRSRVASFRERKRRAGR